MNWALPSVFALFGVGFIAISRIGFPTALWGVAFCFIGGGYAATMLHTQHFSAIKPLGEDALWLMGTAIMTTALGRRFRLPRAYRAKAAIVGFALVGGAFSLGVDRSVRLESFFIQGGCSLLLIHCLLRISRRRKSRADWIMLGAFTTVTILLMVQCIGFLLTPEAGSVVGAWQKSFWGQAIEYTGFLIAALLSFSILLAISLDLIEKYRGFAQIDPLTGVLNRRGFEEFVSSARKSHMLDRPAAILVADIDHFKTINDCFGHQAGDAVIAGFAAILRHAIGGTGCIAWVGGEEFAAFLPMTSLDEALLVGEIARHEFCQRSWPEISGALSSTASFGITVLHQNETLAQSLRRADLMLYQAKQRGRNCVFSSDLREDALGVEPSTPWSEQEGIVNETPARN